MTIDEDRIPNTVSKDRVTLVSNELDTYTRKYSPTPDNQDHLQPSRFTKEEQGVPYNLFKNSLDTVTRA